MQITLELQSPGKLDFLLDLLRGLGYVKILQPLRPTPMASPEQPEPSESGASDAVDFREFWGVIQPQLGLETIDQRIAEGRED